MDIYIDRYYNHYDLFNYVNNEKIDYSYRPQEEFVNSSPAYEPGIGERIDIYG